MSAPIVLVPGFWLGAWAWDDIVRDASLERAFLEPVLTISETRSATQP